jgi:hypothetical protein
MASRDVLSEAVLSGVKERAENAIRQLKSILELVDVISSSKGVLEKPEPNSPTWEEYVSGCDYVVVDSPALNDGWPVG